METSKTRVLYCVIVSSHSQNLMHHCLYKKEVINIFSTFLCPLRQSGNYFFLAQFPFVSSDLFFSENSAQWNECGLLFRGLS